MKIAKQSRKKRKAQLDTIVAKHRRCRKSRSDDPEEVGQDHVAWLSDIPDLSYGLLALPSSLDSSERIARLNEFIDDVMVVQESVICLAIVMPNTE